jgi:hypothetical protein
MVIVDGEYRLLEGAPFGLGEEVGEFLIGGQLRSSCGP